VYQVPRGTRDFNPEEMIIRRYVEENMKATFTKFGYVEIQTPTFENLELFTAKSGDSIIDEIYGFSDKGGRKLALRPELTAPVIRFYVEKLQMEPKPLKLFYFGSCFRYDRPQKGRYREFQQAGCEIIGADTPEAYAELIALAYNLLINIGLKNITLNIGNLNIIDSMFSKINISENCKKELLPLIDKNQFEDLYKILSNKGISKENVEIFIELLQTSDISKIEKFIKNDCSTVEELSKLKTILNLLKNSFKIDKYQIKMSIVRGLDYYKGLVFEIDAPDLGAEKQLCGGGAYDLVKLFGGRDTSTAGFAIGFDRTILALDSEHFIFPTQKTDVYIIPVNKEITAKSIEIAQKLRKEGIITEVDLLQRGVSKSLKHANSKKSEKTIIIGSRELEKDSVTLRNMKTGDQKLVKIAEILTKLKKNN
jgi:histidyl-tRNA synthetase